jgi:hypothetical protein
LDASGIIANISVGGINDSVKDILLCSGLCHIIGRNTALSHVYPRNQNQLDVHFFLVSGFCQIFWVVPIVKRWGDYWYYAGIVGSLISIAVYVEYPIYLLGILTKVLQATFIVLCGVILWKNRSILWKNRSIGDKNFKGM